MRSLHLLGFDLDLRLGLAGRTIDNGRNSTARSGSFSWPRRDGPGARGGHSMDRFSSIRL
jgi:hypothetical protein